MHNQLYKIEGERNLAYDPRTNGVIDTDTEGYKKYIQQKQFRQQQNNRIETMENRINNIEEGLSDIKTLLTRLLEKENGNNN
jgi:hypothetical protein